MLWRRKAQDMREVHEHPLDRLRAELELIDDDDVAGHAICALRSYGPKTALPHLRRARPKLEAVITRRTATPFAKRQAQKALERLAVSP